MVTVGRKVTRKCRDETSVRKEVRRDRMTWEWQVKSEETVNKTDKL
jgi:hypothetical protein